MVPENIHTHPIKRSLEILKGERASQQPKFIRESIKLKVKIPGGEEVFK